MDYIGLLGSEDRARRFSEEVLDRLATFFGKDVDYDTDYVCITNILFWTDGNVLSPRVKSSQDDAGDDHDNHEYDDHIDSMRI